MPCQLGRPSNKCTCRKQLGLRRASWRRTIEEATCLCFFDPLNATMSNPAGHHVPELLAPAGDWESLRAAVANGADAVYFGLSNFNARHRATNFTLAELPEVMSFLHDRNVLGY